MFVCGFVRSWLSCWKRRSWAVFPCSSLQTSRTCWRPRRPPRSPRVSTCTPSATASGRSSRAPPSPGRASRCVSACCSCPSLSRSRVEVKRVHHIYHVANLRHVTMETPHSCRILCTLVSFRRAWIGSARASTPRRSSLVSSLLILRRKSNIRARAHTHTPWALLWWSFTCECTTNPPQTWYF